ncbi:hypothetical protein AB0393_25920 [Streptomyces cyaneofuscatus]|uniref:hypothetical protein n=1 Tax=Streptomyces TaxID=1883 RepID=UPI00344B97B7
MAASIALGAAIFVGGLEQADSVAAIMGAVTGLLGISVSIPAIIKGKSGWESNSNGGVAAVPGPADIAELIAIWSDIERMISDDAPDKAKANRSGLSALLHDFSQRHNLSPDFLKEASRVAAVRNDLAHGRGGIPSDEIPGHLRRAQKLAKTVKKISERT